MCCLQTRGREGHYPDRLAVATMPTFRSNGQRYSPAGSSRQTAGQQIPGSTDQQQRFFLPPTLLFRACRKQSTIAAQRFETFAQVTVRTHFSVLAPPLNYVYQR